jgi:Methyltransferase FkbM domain
MELKKFIFGMLPQSVQRKMILKKTGHNLFRDAQATPGVKFDIYTTPKIGVWKTRLQTPYGHEPQVVKWFEKNLVASDVVYDIGAHMGYYAVLATRLAPGVEFHAFEANWFIAHYLKLNKQLHDTVGKWFIVEKFVGNENKKGFVTMDTYTQTNHPASIFFMDVDGEEINVLNGAKRMLDKADCTFLIEVHPVDLKNRNQEVSGLLQLFSANKYELRYLPNHRGKDSVWSETISAEELKNEFFLLATPRSNPRY